MGSSNAIGRYLNVKVLGTEGRRSGLKEAERQNEYDGARLAYWTEPGKSPERSLRRLLSARGWTAGEKSTPLGFSIRGTSYEKRLLMFSPRGIT
jgi:hypothetical protein